MATPIKKRRREIPLPVTKRDIATFCRSFSILIETGMPVLRSLKILGERTSKVRLRKIVLEISAFVENGGTVSGAMAKHPKFFSPMIVSMIRIGETSGTLDQALHRIADLLEKQIALKQKVQSAFAYPVIALLASVAVIIFILVWVIPVFIPLYNDPEKAVPMPVPTQIIISVSEFLTTYWYLYIPVLLGVILLLILFGKTRGGKFFYDRIRLRVPLFGTLYTKMVIERFTRTTAILLHSGIPLLETLKLVRYIVGSENIAEVIDRAHDVLQQGGTLEETLRESEYIPPLTVDIISIGEQAGALEDVLMRIADILDEEIDVTVRGITSIIEPVMVLVVGGVVLFIALSVFLPYWGLVKVI